MKVDLPLRGSGHPKAFGKRGGESLPNGGDLPIACDHDVHAVDESRTGERLLRSEEIHHDEVPTVHTPDAFGFDQTSHRELAPAGRCLELESRAHVEPVRRGKASWQKDRIRLAQEHERILDRDPALVADVVDAD